MTASSFRSSAWTAVRLEQWRWCFHNDIDPDTRSHRPRHKCTIRTRRRWHLILQERTAAGVQLSVGEMPSNACTHRPALVTPFVRAFRCAKLRTRSSPQLTPAPGSGLQASLAAERSQNVETNVHDLWDMTSFKSCASYSSKRFGGLVTVFHDEESRQLIEALRTWERRISIPRCLLRTSCFHCAIG